MDKMKLKFHFENVANHIFQQSLDDSHLDVRFRCSNGKTVRANKQILSLGSLLFRSVLGLDCDCANYQPIVFDVICPDFSELNLGRVIDSILNGKQEVRGVTETDINEINSILETFQIFALFIDDQYRVRTESATESIDKDSTIRQLIEDERSTSGHPVDPIDDDDEYSSVELDSQVLNASSEQNRNDDDEQVPNSFMVDDEMFEEEQRQVNVEPSRRIPTLEPKKPSSGLSDQSFRNIQGTSLGDGNIDVCFTCFICGQKFANATVCKIHMSVEHYANSNRCSLCDKVFSTEFDLMSHICENATKSKCHICKKEFGQKKHLKKHYFTSHKIV